MNEAKKATTAELIEQRIDRDEAGKIAISQQAGGLDLSRMSEVMEAAKLMAVSGVAVPAHLRAVPGACMAIVIQALEWRMSPFAVANKSYVVNDRLCFESHLIHAVIEQRAPLRGRLRHSFAGEGENRTCKVWGYLGDDPEPFELVSPPIGKIKPKNSPLWGTKPDLQLYYNTSRDWARTYCPDVILGVYSDDEIEQVRPVGLRPRTLEELTARLKPQTEETQPQLGDAAEGEAT